MDQTGRPGPHSADQGELYANWQYKPMPMTLDEAQAVAESEEHLSYNAVAHGSVASAANSEVRPTSLPSTGASFAIAGMLLVALALGLRPQSRRPTAT